MLCVSGRCLDNMILDKVYRKNPDFIFRNIAGEAVLVPVKNKAADMEYIYVLNPVAARAWDLLDGEKSGNDIVDIILSEFEVGPDMAVKDLEDFFNDSIGSGFLNPVN